MKRHIVLAVVFAVALVAAFSVARQTVSDQPLVTLSPEQSVPSVDALKNCVADECLAAEGFEFPAETLTLAAQDALREALDDEYRAAATYAAVLEKFGMRRPFSMIIRAEEQHISRLKALYDKYGIAVPENPYLGSIPSPETFSVACRTGVEAEIANAALYDKRLIPMVEEYPDIVRVFENLRDASQSRHLPAFERCK